MRKKNTKIFHLLRRHSELIVLAPAPADNLQDLVVGNDDGDDVEDGRELAEGEHPAEQVLMKCAGSRG